MLRKITVCFVITLIAFSAIFFSNQQKVSAIQNVWMEIIPRKISTAAVHKWHYTIEKKLEVHQSITLFFGEGTTLVPPLPEDPIKLRERLTQIIESMSIGLSPCSACQGLPIIKFRKDGTMESLTFNTHIELNPEIEGYRDIVVTAAAVCGFTTPTKPGFYIYGVATGAESTKVNSAPFEIVESKLGVPEGIPEVFVEPPTFNSPAKYTISFNVGRGGWLQSGASLIKLKFPEETTFLKPFNEIKPENITINGSPISGAINGFKKIINFVNPVEIKDSGRVVVELNEKVGIKNPADRGEYYIEVSTSSEGEWVKSTPYQVQTGVSKLQITPPKINRVAEYTLTFVLNVQELKKGNAIYVKFPDSVILPATINKENILINNEIPSSIEKKNSEILVYTNKDLKKDDGIAIVFTKDCGIKNPSAPTKVQLQYRPSNYNTYESSPSVDILEGKLEVGEVIVDPKNAGEIATYQIPITLGDNDTLNNDNFGYIAVKFPEGTQLSNQIITGISIQYADNGNDIPIGSFAKIKDSIGIWVDEKIPGGKSLIINFDKTAGIINPETVKAFTLSVFTENDGPANSEPYNILPPLPISAIVITGGKIGKNNWYIVPPLVKFICTDPQAVIILVWDNKDNQPIIYDGIEKPLDIGQYETILHYHAKTAYGEEVVKDQKFKVDTVTPEVVVESPKEAKISTNISPIDIFGRITAVKTVLYGVDVIKPDELVWINDQKIPVKITEDPEKQTSSGEFSLKLDLKQGENQIHIIAEDLAGNSTTKDFVVIFDSIPPTIEIIEPAQSAVIITPKYQIKGKTEPDVQLLINGEVVFVESDGSFIYDAESKIVEKKEFTIQATDWVGNVTEIKLSIWIGYTIMLQIGKTKATVNEIENALDAPPYIRSGRTMVPLRFIGQAFGGKITFEQKKSGKTYINTIYYQQGTTSIILIVGSKTAKVNNKNITLEVPPEIVKSRTYVPLRFFSEVLGAKIDWEPKEEIITIKYLPLVGS